MLSQTKNIDVCSKTQPV